MKGGESLHKPPKTCTRPVRAHTRDQRVQEKVGESIQLTKEPTKDRVHQNKRKYLKRTGRAYTRNKRPQQGLGEPIQGAKYSQQRVQELIRGGQIPQ